VRLWREKKGRKGKKESIFPQYKKSKQNHQHKGNKQLLVSRIDEKLKVNVIYMCSKSITRKGG